MCSPTRYILLKRQYTEEASDKEVSEEASYRELEILVRLLAEQENFSGQIDNTC